MVTHGADKRVLGSKDRRMREREARHEVTVPARLRVDDGWQDAIILNLSTRGLMFRCTAPVQRGHFLELRRGGHVIVAQVMWSDGGKCGARAQGFLPIAELMFDKPAKRTLLTPRERRVFPRTTAERAAQARQSGRAMPFAPPSCLPTLHSDFSTLRSQPSERHSASIDPRRKKPRPIGRGFFMRSAMTFSPSANNRSR